MRKKIFILLILLINFFVINYYTNYSNENNNEINVSNIYLQDEKIDISYYENKYDIYNYDINYLKMEESYSQNNSKIGTTSTAEDLSVDFVVTIDKSKSCMLYSYKVKKANATILERNIEIYLTKYNNEYYLKSNDNKVIKLSDALTKSKTESCALCFACYDEMLGLNDFNNLGFGGGGGGGAIGMGLGLAAAGALALATGSSTSSSSGSGLIYNGSSSSTSSSSSSTATTTSTGLSNDIINDILNSDDTTFDDFFKRTDVKNKLGDFSDADAKELLCLMLGISSLTELENSSKDRVLCIGRDMGNRTLASPTDAYQNYASKYNYWAFFNSNYNSYVKEYTQNVMDIVNQLLVIYCCKNDWDFILVTDPYNYMEEHFTNQYYGKGYKMEIKIIRSCNYNNFTNVNYTWQTLPNPGNSESAHYKYAGYRVSR